MAQCAGDLHLATGLYRAHWQQVQSFPVHKMVLREREEGPGVCAGLEITFSLVLSNCQYNARFVLSNLNFDLPIPPSTHKNLM